MNINTKTKLMGAVLCALGVLSSDFASATNAPQLAFYYGGQECRSMYRQAQGIMTMFGGLAVQAGRIADAAEKDKAFRLIYDAMCAYFRLYPENFNIGRYHNDATYEEYAKQQTIGDFETKIKAMEQFFNISTDEDREDFERLGEQNVPFFGARAMHSSVYAESGRVGNAIVETLGLKNPTNNFVDAIDIAGDMAIADTQAKKDILMFYRCIRSSMSLNNFGYSMITPQGKEFTNFIINTLK